MAKLKIELSNDSNRYTLNKHPYLDLLYKNFETKWKENIQLFEGGFLKDGYIIAPPRGISVDGLRFSVTDDGDTPNFDRAVFRFLSTISGGEELFSTGEVGFEEEFYNDIYEMLIWYDRINFINEVNDDYEKGINRYQKWRSLHPNLVITEEEISIEVRKHVENYIKEAEDWGMFCGTVLISIESGYYSTHYCINPKGLYVSCDYYEDDDEEEDSDY